MKKSILITALTLAPVHTVAEQDTGRGLMEYGLELFLEGLQQEIEPALDELRALTEQAGPLVYDFLLEMGPALADIAEQVEDWSNYHPPEILPNGDIIMRRKTPAELEVDPDKDGTDI
ncbi:MAG: hypothetical protein ACU0BB_17360 [Paracoccaceae bacterium]|jgi:hypothetical protein